MSKEQVVVARKKKKKVKLLFNLTWKNGNIKLVKLQGDTYESNKLD